MGTTITIEQIDLIMERANVSYAEAKAALEQTNGDVVEALMLLEKEQKIKTKEIPSAQSKKSDKFMAFINKLNATSFTMKKKERTIMDIPLSIAIIIIACTFYVSVVGIVAAMLCGVKVEIKGENDVAEKINSTIEQINKTNE